MKHVIKIVVLAILFSACHEAPIVIPDFVPPTTNKVILLEDLTGVQCPNCPKGSAVIETLLEQYPNNLAAVGIHGDFLAAPIAGKSHYDFRIPESKDLEVFYTPFLGKPAAGINRVHFANEEYLSVDNTELWGSYIQAELQREQEVIITIEKTYDTSSRKLTLNCKFIPRVDLAGDYNVSVFLTESNIIDYQKDGTETIEHYEHNHVLRDMLTASLGDHLATNMKQTEGVSKTFEYVMPAGYNDTNCEIIVALSKSGSSDARVIDALKTKVAE